MPNGGSDCCGTCWFNLRNKGKWGHEHANDPEPNFCTIRGLAIPVPFWTYCFNHPGHRYPKDSIPIGPVFATGKEGRKLWTPSPDTEEVRLHLLQLLAFMNERQEDKHPIRGDTGAAVVWQLAQFRESRAIPGLQLLKTLSPEQVAVFLPVYVRSLSAAVRWALKTLGAED
jgi:hypothetical protein